MSKQFAKDVARLYQSLLYSNKQLQHSAAVARFCIKSAGEKKRGHKPRTEDTYAAVQEFVYHYENFCYRVYAFREKLLKFLNEILPLGLPDDQVNMRIMQYQSLLKTTSLVKDLRQFQEPHVLGQIIVDRNALTHKLYYSNVDHYLRPVGTPKVIDKSWFIDWGKQVEVRANRATKGMQAITDLVHSTSDKIVKHKIGN